MKQNKKPNVQQYLKALLEAIKYHVNDQQDKAQSKANLIYTVTMDTRKFNIGREDFSKALCCIEELLDKHSPEQINTIVRLFMEKVDGDFIICAEVTHASGMRSLKPQVAEKVNQWLALVVGALRQHAVDLDEDRFKRSYTQYLNTAKNQYGFSKTLIKALQNAAKLITLTHTPEQLKNLESVTYWTGISDTNMELAFVYSN